MQTIGDYISLIFLLIFGIWIGSLIHTYYMRQILSELKKLNQGTPSDPKTIPRMPPSTGSLMYCTDCDRGYRPERHNSCPECGGTNRYLKSE